MATCAGTEGFLGFVSRGDADPGSRASKAAGTRREDGAASRERPGESPSGSRAARGDLPARERVKRASTEVEIIPRYSTSRDRQRVDKKKQILWGFPPIPPFIMTRCRGKRELGAESDTRETLLARNPISYHIFLSANYVFSL